MNILHINSYYSDSKFYKNLFDNQVINGLDISVYIPIPKSMKILHEVGSYANISENHNKNDRFIFHIKHKRILKDIQKKENIKSFDLIHAHSLFSNGYIAYMLNKKYNIPYVVAIRSTDVKVFFKYSLFLRTLGINILQNAEKIFFISKPYKDILLSKYIPKDISENINNKSAIIPNGINDFWLSNKNTEKTLINKTIQILSTGKIIKRKNHMAVVTAINILIKKGYKITYTIVGDAIDKKIFEKLNKESFITYIPPKSKEELIDIYRQSDIFIMPSKSETFGLVYAEAMSQGLPVIYTKDEGFDGQFEDGVVGYCVNPDDPEDISNKILEMRKVNASNDSQIEIDEVTVVKDLFPLLTNLNFSEMDDREIRYLVGNPPNWFLTVQNVVKQIVAETELLYYQQELSKISSISSKMALVDLMNAVPNVLIENAKKTGELDKLKEMVEKQTEELENIVKEGK